LDYFSATVVMVSLTRRLSFFALISFPPSFHLSYFPSNGILSARVMSEVPFSSDSGFSDLPVPFPSDLFVEVSELPPNFFPSLLSFLYTRWKTLSDLLSPKMPGLPKVCGIAVDPLVRLWEFFFLRERTCAVRTTRDV